MIPIRRAHISPRRRSRSPRRRRTLSRSPRRMPSPRKRQMPPGGDRDVDMASKRPRQSPPMRPKSPPRRLSRERDRHPPPPPRNGRDARDTRGMPDRRDDKDMRDPRDMRGARDTRNGGRDVRDMRDGRGARDPRDARGARDMREGGRDPRDGRGLVRGAGPRDVRDNRDLRDSRAAAGRGDVRDTRDPRDVRDPRGGREDPRDARGGRDNRDERDRLRMAGQIINMDTRLSLSDRLPSDRKVLGNKAMFRGPEGVPMNRTELEQIELDVPMQQNLIKREVVNPQDVRVARRPGEGARPIFDGVIVNRTEDQLNRVMTSHAYRRTPPPTDRPYDSLRSSGSTRPHEYDRTREEGGRWPAHRDDRPRNDPQRYGSGGGGGGDQRPRARSRSYDRQRNADENRERPGADARRPPSPADRRRVDDYARARSLERHELLDEALYRRQDRFTFMESDVELLPRHPPLVLRGFGRALMRGRFPMGRVPVLRPGLPMPFRPVFPRRLPMPHPRMIRPVYHINGIPHVSVPVVPVRPHPFLPPY